MRGHLLNRIAGPEPVQISKSPNLPISESVHGNVVEIFSGIQGEGIHVGRRQIFLRLAGCNLRCDYCDQPEARRIPRQGADRVDARPPGFHGAAESARGRNGGASRPAR